MTRRPGTNRWTVLCVLLLALLAATAGCAKPTAKLVGMSLSNIDLNSATVDFKVNVTNPYPVAMPLANLDYRLASGASPIVSGEAPIQDTVPAFNNKTISLPLTINFKELAANLKGFKLGTVVPYDAEVGVSVDAPALGLLRLPIKKSGQLPIPAVPKVKIRDIAWSTLSYDKAVGVVTLDVENTNTFALNLEKLTYALSLGGVDVAKSTLTDAVSFEGSGGTGTVQLAIDFAPKDLGLGVLKMLGSKGTGYAMTGNMAVDTAHGKMQLPLNAAGIAAFGQAKSE